MGIPWKLKVVSILYVFDMHRIPILKKVMMPRMSRKQRKVDVYGLSTLLLVSMNQK